MKKWIVLTQITMVQGGTRSIAKAMEQYANSEDSDSESGDEMDVATMLKGGSSVRSGNLTSPTESPNSSNEGGYYSTDDDDEDDEESISLGLNEEGTQYSSDEEDEEESEGGWQDEEDESSQHTTEPADEPSQPSAEHSGCGRNRNKNLLAQEGNDQWKLDLGATDATKTGFKKTPAPDSETMSLKISCSEGEPDDDYEALIAGVINMKHRPSNGDDNSNSQVKTVPVPSSVEQQCQRNPQQESSVSSTPAKEATNERKKKKKQAGDGTGRSTAKKTSSKTADTSGTESNSVSNEPKHKRTTSQTEQQDKELSAAAEAHLEKRRRQRAERMQKVRERIAKEKEEEERNKQEEAKRQAGLAMSEEGRRERAYEWYLRSGMLNRTELKKRIAHASKTGEGASMQLNAEDIDLLPWNFNGTMINVSRLMSMKKATISPR